MNLFWLWAVVAIVLFVFGLAAVKVFGDEEIDEDHVKGFLPVCALWPITLTLAIIGGFLFGLYKGAVWLLQVVKEAYEQYSSQREG